MAIRKERLLDLMQANKMSYQDLADITHVHKSTLQRYFTGSTKKIPVERIWPIAFALGTTPQYLMGDTDDPSPTYSDLKEDDLLNKTIKSIRDLDNTQLKSVLAFIRMISQEDI